MTKKTMTHSHGKACGLSPTIDDLAKDYGLPGLVQLFNDKAQDIELANVQGLTIKELGLENANCIIRFSYMPEYKHPAWLEGRSRTGFSISLRHADNNERIVEAVHCLSQTMTGQFNYTGGGTSYEGFENMRFVAENPPHKIMKAILNPASKM